MVFVSQQRRRMGALASKRQGHNSVQRCGVVHLFAHSRLLSGVEIMNLTRVAFPVILRE